MTSLLFWMSLALLDFTPWMIFFQQSISLVFQLFLHTERVTKLWCPVEAVFNTPSHHRAHHASTQVYLDRNFGGMLIVWDRLFGAFRAEDGGADYGLAKNIETYNR
ncbi:sterol desaturase family protein [Streptomyces sp. NPDC001774]